MKSFLLIQTALLKSAVLAKKNFESAFSAILKRFQNFSRLQAKSKSSGRIEEFPTEYFF
jgi:hypothetical protein